MMGRTVGELLDAMDADELAWWKAYHRLHPFGPEVDDLRCARSQTMFANAHFAGKGKRFKLREYLLGDAGSSGQQSWSGQRDQMMAAFRRRGVEVSRGGEGHSTQGR